MESLKADASGRHYQSNAELTHRQQKIKGFLIYIASSVLYVCGLCANPHEHFVSIKTLNRQDLVTIRSISI